MKELQKLKEAAHALDFSEASRIPPVSPLIGGRTYQICAVDDPFAKKIYFNHPNSIQCQAMRAIIYFWKVLRIREAIVYDYGEKGAAVKLDFGEARMDVELPAEIGVSPVSPVRMVANLVIGKLHDEAIATRGKMLSEELDAGIAANLVHQAHEEQGAPEDLEGDDTGIRKVEPVRSPTGGATEIEEQDVVDEVEDISDSLEVVED